jgi:broad specificity phosphatase PhoE
VAHGGRIYGQTDLSCDCSKTALFTGLAEKLPHSAIWVTSNLRRTHETAAAIVRAGLRGPQPIPGPEAIMMPEFAEQDFGEWQGMTYEKLQESRAGDFHRFWHAPAHETPPGGESFVAVIERVSRAIHRLSRPIPDATSSPSRMAARSAPRWHLRSTSTRKPRSPSRSRIARSPASTGSTVPAWATVGASSE